MTTPQLPLDKKELHDLQAAWRSLTLAIKAIESGYKFDDAEAKLKTTTLVRALSVLERYIPNYIEQLKQEAHK